VPAEAGEEARARMLDLFPAGFEERDDAGVVELAAYTDADGEARARVAFGDVDATAVEPGWEDRWREFHRPVRIGPLWIGPPWETPEPGALAVVIDPGRAFGTGAHATTRLCLELLLDVEPGALLDLGCGSGVLAIAAAKLGFDPVTALDDDPAAVEAARANAEANGVHIAVEQADVLGDPQPEAAVAVANIELAAVEALATRVRAPVFIASGYLAADPLEPDGWRSVRGIELDGWAANRFERD
jgi:ribosomal protein L11 methyltransferase